ncbi:MAG: acylphosphatase [Thaumarchaeota archaeon]|nr:acylphosphatase [Nitrososphaerota archaeon]
MNRRADMTVSGVVQGVGFRYMARIAARQCLLRGEVENMEDETVRITCEGEEEGIGRFVEAVRGAKKPIEVDDVRVEYSEPTGEFKSFRIVMGDLVTEMSEGFGAGSAYFRMMLEKQDLMLEKQDSMLEKQDDTVKEIRSLSSSMHDMMDARFQRLEDEISKIKAKLP